MHDRAIELDESLVRAIHDERLDGRKSLLDDMRRGHHARNVIAGIEHAKLNRGEHVPFGGELEMRLEAVVPAAGFHELARQENTYECWDDDDYLDWRMKRFPEVRVRTVPRKVSLLVQGNKYGPPRV